MIAGILKYCNSVYLWGSRAVRSAVMRALQMTVSARSERRKGNPLRKHTIKDTFRYLITIWSLGIAKRGLNEHIFVKTSNLTKIYIFHSFFFFFACSSKQPVCILHSFCQHGSHITSLNHGEVPNCYVLMTYRTRCLRKSDLPVYMTVALAHIRFISNLFPHMNEA